MMHIMEKMELHVVMSNIVMKYYEHHVKAFYASSLIEDLQANGIKNADMEKEVVLFLDSFVREGFLKRKYIIFNPENPREYKTYNEMSEIPIGEEIKFDFNDVYVDSSLIETFFVFTSPKKKITNPKEDSLNPLTTIGFREFKPQVLPSLKKNGINLSNNKIDKLNIQIKMTEGSHMSNDINQNFSGSTIGQAGANISNKDTNITVNNSNKEIDLEKVRELISEIKTGNANIDSEISQLKALIEKDEPKSEKKDKVTKLVNNIYTGCKALGVALPALNTLFQLFGIK